MNFKKGEQIFVAPFKSEKGKGLSYKSFHGKALEDGFTGGWDVWDVEDEKGKQLSVYGFSIAKTKAIKNPSRADRTPAKKFLDFSGRSRVRKTMVTIPSYPKEWIFIGNAPEINYLSDKKDGVKRLYKHPLKKHGKLVVSPDGKIAMIFGLNLNIKKEGLTG